VITGVSITVPSGASLSRRGSRAPHAPATHRFTLNTPKRPACSGTELGTLATCWSQPSWQAPLYLPAATSSTRSSTSVSVSRDEDVCAGQRWVHGVTAARGFLGTLGGYASPALASSSPPGSTRVADLSGPGQSQLRLTSCRVADNPAWSGGRGRHRARLTPWQSPTYPRGEPSRQKTNRATAVVDAKRATTALSWLARVMMHRVDGWGSRHLFSRHVPGEVEGLPTRRTDYSARRNIARTARTSA
jgi:hypothetical protein